MASKVLCASRLIGGPPTPNLIGFSVSLGALTTPHAAWLFVAALRGQANTVRVRYNPSRDHCRTWGIGEIRNLQILLVLALVPRIYIEYIDLNQILAFGPC